MVGSATKKVLSVQPRNSACHACKTGNKSHDCNRNHVGSAGSMEPEGLVAAFQEAETVHGCRYGRFVGDGDSSNLDAIVSQVSIVTLQETVQYWCHIPYWTHVA